MTFRDLIKKIIYIRQWWLFKKVENYTMVGHGRLYELYEIAERIERQGLAGSFVECGVWKGGAAAVMAEIVKKHKSKRDLWLFDSFVGLPEPSLADGDSAFRQYNKNKGGCDISDVEEVLFGIIGINRNQVKITVGWFNETLPAYKQSVGDISLLRLDCDWYESTKICLDILYDNVVPGGYVLIDDYSTWPGCRQAVDEFFKNKKIEADLVVGTDGAAFFQKPLFGSLGQYWSIESLKYQKPHERIRKIYREIIKGSTSGSVLDIGCGPASLALLLQSGNFKYSGVDVFKQNIPSGRYRVFDLEHDDFSNFPFDEIFDVVVISGVIEYLSIERVRELLKYLRLKLSDRNTKIIITYTNFSHYSRKIATYHPRWVMIKKIDDIREEFRAAGFSIVRFYPSYYFIFRRRLNLRFRLPGLFKYFGRQVIFILQKS
ncbi:MAG: class I SAM-dependent methyltransferase [Patescibacteria group bacterium]|jgi:SAM-dependent methyltransferase